MDPSFSSSPSTGNPNAMPPRPLKRSASSEPPLPSSSPASSTATKRQRSLYDFFSRSSSPAAPPANALKREPIMSPTRGHVYPVTSPRATASSPSATICASALTSPTKPRPTTHQRPQASTSSSAAAAATAAPSAPAPARSTPAAISLQLSDSSDDENKVAAVAPETPRRVRVRPNVRPVQIEILVPPLPHAVEFKRPAAAPVPRTALAESKNVNDASPKGRRVLRPRNASVVPSLENPGSPTTTTTSSASSTASSTPSSRYGLRTRPAPPPTTTYADLTLSPSPPLALPEPKRVTRLARRGRGRPRGPQGPPRPLMRTLSSSSTSLSDLSSLSDDERDDDGDDLDIASIAPRPVGTPAKCTTAAATASGGSTCHPHVADSSPLTSAFSSRVNNSSPPSSPGASPGSGSDRSATSLSTVTGSSLLELPPALRMGLSGLVVSESEDEEEEKAATAKAAATHFTCPFCGKTVSNTWDDVIDDVYQRILKYVPPLVKAAQKLKRQTRESKLEFIHKHQFDTSMSNNMDEHVRATKPICDKHKRRAVLLEAQEKGWPKPEAIDWERFAQRIRADGFLDLLDGVVESYHTSPYGGVYAHMVQVYNECGGGARYRNQAMLSKKLEMNRVGYYGQRGAFELFNALADAFLHDPVSALGPAELGAFRESEFVSDILVPTAGVILIQQDMQAELGREVSFDEAWEKMKETAEYGDVIAPLQKT